MTAHLTGPVQASERIQTLDIVRGFALLGILIMNMPGFASSFFAEADGSHLWADALNQRAEQIRDMLFSGKFNSMFSLLFGIGFTIQLARMMERDPQHGLTPVRAAAARPLRLCPGALPRPLDRRRAAHLCDPRLRPPADAQRVEQDSGDPDRRAALLYPRSPARCGSW